MKRFCFPLERVRRWRGEQAHLEELKLQQLRAERDGLAARRREIDAELEQNIRCLMARPSMDPLELTSLEGYRLHMQQLGREVDCLVEQCGQKVAAQRDRVVEARRQFDLLDRLYHKALREWQAAANHEQETLAGELYLAKGIRNR